MGYEGISTGVRGHWYRDMRVIVLGYEGIRAGVRRY